MAGQSDTKIAKKPMSFEENIQRHEENIERSMRRTQKQLQDTIECNAFDWFGTFTFDPKKIDRHDDNAVTKAMTKWLNNQKRTSPDMTYILVPERHKTGAIHFHALIGQFNGKMAQSGSKWQGQPIFNLQSYNLGFTNFTKIRNKEKTANYCRKYITKDMYQVTNGKKRYWASQNLVKPEKAYNLTVDELIEQNQGQFDLKKMTVYENEHVEIVNFPLKQK